MRTLTGQLILAVVLLLAGAGLWAAGRVDLDVARAASDLAAFQYDQAATLDGGQVAGRLLRQVPGVDAAAVRAQTIGDTARYWQGTLPAGSPATATLFTANAAYRAAMRDGGPWPTVVARLDEVVKQYAAIVRERPDDEDAAFNYEFVVRLRAALAAAKRDVPPDLLESDVTLHGLAGAPPKGTANSTFKLIVPMQPDERREAEQAGRNAPQKRKG